MKSSSEILQDIERKYQVDRIKINNFNAWQIIRNAYASEYEKNIFDNRSKEKDFSKFKTLNLKIQNSLWQCKNYFKTYKYILFTDMLEERRIERSNSDKIAHNLIKMLDDDLLVILNPIYFKHRNVKEYYHKNYMSSTIFSFINKIKRNKLRYTDVEGEEILKNIEIKYGLKVDYIYIINEFFNLVSILDKYFAISKPQLVFVNCYYRLLHQAVIYTAHKNGIKVIELQHGIINDEHYAYNIHRKIGRESFPDYIYTFGDYVKNHISSNFVEQNNIIPIGNFYIEYTKNQCKKNEELTNYFKKKRENFKKIVVITSQVTIEEELINFIINAANISKDVLYIFIPRFFNKDFTVYNFPENMIIHRKIDFYQTVGFCDFHLTVYSSCALESLYFGVPNILININNLSKIYYDKILYNKECTRYVENYNELVNVIYNWNDFYKENIFRQGNYFYKNGNYNNLGFALNKILKSELSN